jgi:hypothetical protein
VRIIRKLDYRALLPEELEWYTRGIPREELIFFPGEFFCEEGGTHKEFYVHKRSHAKNVPEITDHNLTPQIFMKLGGL